MPSQFHIMIGHDVQTFRQHILTSFFEVIVHAWNLARYLVKELKIVTDTIANNKYWYFNVRALPLQSAVRYRYVWMVIVFHPKFQFSHLHVLPRNCVSLTKGNDIKWNYVETRLCWVITKKGNSFEKINIAVHLGLASVVGRCLIALICRWEGVILSLLELDELTL